MKTEYATEVASTAGASTKYPRITLGPVNVHASLVTLKMPAPMRIPSSVAYDSIVPRSRRRPSERAGLTALFKAASSRRTPKPDILANSIRLAHPVEACLGDDRA